ncbi:hypothetical protein [Bacillus niameyensis]|uniref:hypothetical protein n=1 Tax=Bacillus niameyensis TaxID=1522308 RepID=UPI000785F49C|nr:hypothetical protein [Bacillus niameyensis]
MYYDEELLFAEDFRRNRRRNNDLNVACECNLVEADTDRNPDCGCGGHVDPIREEKHVYHHIIREEAEGGNNVDSCGVGPAGKCSCGQDNCVCNQLRNLAMNTEVTLLLRGSANPVIATFVSFDRNTCCATFINAEIPGAPGPATDLGTIIINCKEIQVVGMTP